MNSYLVRFSGIVFAIGFMWAGGSAADAQDWARKMFQEFEHDFGSVAKGSFVEHRFEIQNIYKEDIHIREVVSSCGCTTPSLTTHVLKTWEKGYVVARFNTNAFNGFKQATLTVRFDAPFFAEVQLLVRGNIKTDVMFQPGTVDFGEVALDQLPERLVRVTHVGSPDWKIVDVRSTFRPIKVQMRNSVRQGSQVIYDLAVRLTEDVPVGFVSGELFVVADESDRRVDIPLKFSGKVTSGGLQLSPEILTLSPVKPGEEIKRKVIIKADQPFRITDVTCHSTSFRVKADPSAKTVHFVDVYYTGEETPGRHECDLSFITDLAGTKTVGKIKAIVEIAPNGK